MTLAKLRNDWMPSFPSMIDRFFEGDLMDWNSTNFAGTNSTLPAVNIRENKDEYKIEVAAPGMKKNDFKINYDNGRLTISSEKTDEQQKEEGERISRKEFCYESFQRSFAISENVVAADKIIANYEEGILNITLPKREEVKPKPAREIKIK